VHIVVRGIEAEAECCIYDDEPDRVQDRLNRMQEIPMIWSVV